MLRQTVRVTDLHPAANSDEGKWLLRPDVDWWDLVRYGPPDFDVYLRIALFPGPRAADPAGEDPAVRLALATLAPFTATPACGYAAIWEGWTSEAHSDLKSTESHRRPARRPAR